MKTNETSQSLMIHCRCNFSHMILGTYNMVLSCQFQREYCKNLSYPMIIKGNLKEKGSKFLIKRPDLNLYLFYEINELIITDYYASFKYHVYKTIPETYEYDYILEIRYVNEDQCDYFFCFVFDHRFYLSEKELHEEFKFKKNLYKNIEKSLRKFEILKISTVYTTINSKIELLWDVLKNMKLIHKYAHILGDKINYNGDIIKKNSIIQLSDIRGKEIFKSIGEVNKYVMNKSEISKEYIIEFFFPNDKNSLIDSSKEKIMIIIYEYNGLCSIYILYFFYNIQKNKEKFSNFTKVKYRELIKFKNIIEKFNETNNKQNSKSKEKK